MVSPHLRFREISGDPNAIVQAIPDTERYIAAISSDPHSSRHGRGQLLLQVHKMEVDGSETLKLVGVLVHLKVCPNSSCQSCTLVSKTNYHNYNNFS
ncbi:hypothetical protein NC652_026067 [Populus alba x Populus x berolinensis]|nr:hypothetical protein NC652_026067 [Populus alba x Populus x berolinensis]